MGSGIAKFIRQKYPQVYIDYKAFINSTPISDRLGSTIFTRINKDLIIATGIGQLYYGRDSNIRYVDYAALEDIFKEVNILAMSTNLNVIFPLIGAGLAGGKWEEIAPIIERTILSRIPKTLFLLD